MQDPTKKMWQEDEWDDDPEARLGGMVSGQMTSEERSGEMTLEDFLGPQ
jgi:hypothetical protein